MLKPIRGVRVIHLKPGGDPRIQITRQSLDIKKNSDLRIVTNGVKAIPFAILGFVTDLDTSWYRPDLNIQFDGDDESVRTWELCAAWIRGAI